MGQRWYKGRLISDEEYSKEKSSEEESTINVMAIALPAIILTILFWFIFSSYKASLIGAGLGIIIGIFFIGFFKKVINAIWFVASILFILLVLTFVGWVIYKIWMSLPS